MNSKPNNRNQQRRANTYHSNSSRRQRTPDMGIQNFQNMVDQINQINHMMANNKANNPMDILNQFFYK